MWSQQIKLLQTHNLLYPQIQLKSTSLQTRLKYKIKPNLQIKQSNKSQLILKNQKNNKNLNLQSDPLKEMAFHHLEVPSIVTNSTFQ